jgi:hypothetical protein
MAQQILLCCEVEQLKTCGMNQNELSKVYGALLSSPGMSEQVKVDLKINRRAVLLLSQVIDRGLSVKGEDGHYGMIDAVSKEEIQELKKLSQDCLEKAGLTELSGNLSAFHGK